MSIPHSFHHKALVALGVLALAAFAALAPSAIRPQSASAQGYQLCNGAYIPNYQTCYSNGYGNGYGNNYSNSYTTCSNGQIVYAPQTCSSTSYQNSYPYCSPPYVSGNSSCCFNGYSGNSSYYGNQSQFCPPNSPATYPAGWNIVSGPSGTTLTGSTGPLYTFSAGSAAYQTLPQGTPLQTGVGYWAYFPSGGSANFGPASSSSTTVQLPPGQFVMIGNPGAGTATVSGANAVVLTYSPTSNGYTQTTQLAPGQGAWAASPTGGTLTITSSAPPPPPPPL
jgi:hypothetical protein